ncbi:MAG: cytochrome c biogenesis protein ResB [Halobacteriovoraceae bacterium]|nr:cytochrome c biogenesis protein ResB [Halobacteriovoraceae bacterium]
MKKSYEAFEKTVGSVKFAVFIVLLFAAVLIYGTFQESYHGVEYAQRHVYKSSAFMLIQLFMFLSIFIATLVRFPPKKNLYGFYTLHAGLLLLFIGSFVTFYSGIDGNIQLPPNTPNRDVLITEDELLIQNKTKGLQLIYPMPYTAGPTTIDESHDNIRILEFLPFTDDIIAWENSEMGGEYDHSSLYQLFNDRFSEEVGFSFNLKSDFKTSSQLGPLSVHYLPQGLLLCFKNPKDDYLIWDSLNQKCLPDAKIQIKNISKDKEVLIAKIDSTVLAFLPEQSPLPIDIKNKNIDVDSPYRLFNRKLFKESPNLFLFGKGVAYFNKAEEKWEAHPIEVGKIVALPWMGFQIKLKEHRFHEYPILKPIYALPIHDNNKLIKGAGRAVFVEVTEGQESKKLWIKKDQPVEMQFKGKRYYFDLRNKVLKLPFELTLNQFKMDKDPGTMNPASYESFITLFQDGKSSKHHIFMNNPLKYQDMTFYQASYFQDPNSGLYGSVLSVNYDPGRAIKYIGSLLLVFGALWHFVLRKKLVSLN